jgi:hypothetical protein
MKDDIAVIAGDGDGRSTQVWSFKSKFLIKQRAVELRK